MTRTRNRTAVLWGVITLVTLGACSGGSPSTRANGASPSPSSASPSAQAVPSTGGTPGSSPRGNRPGSTTSAGTTGSTGSVAGAKPFVTRPPGTYSFDTSGQMQISSTFVNHTYTLPPTTRLEIDPASGSSQQSVRDMRDSKGNGRLTEMRLGFAADGLRLEFLRNTTFVSGVKDERTFQPNPPPLVLRTGAPNGDHLHFTMQGSGVTATTDVYVLRREAVTVGSSSVPSIVIRLHTTFSGDVQGEDTATNWLRPTDGLLLREEDSSDATSGSSRVRTNYTATLKSLTPS